MGLLVEGKWYEKTDDVKESDGRFIRQDSQFRSWVTKDGSAGPTGEAGFKAEPNRYHLYISHACPWANRTMIMRKLKGLEEMISVSVVNPIRDGRGWTFESGEGVIPDPILDADYLYQVYVHADPNYSGRVSVPVLYDLKQGKIVNNESAEILRMFNSAFDEVGAKAGDYYPEDLRAEIDAINEKVYDNVNNGVYKAGFATKQEVYQEEVTKLFKVLDELEERLETNRYLVGQQITEADWRLFVTLIRFDSVYHGHFKCNLKRIVDYKNLWRYTRELYNYPGIKETIHFDHIKNHYYGSHKNINPTGIVPEGPELDFSLE
ncbi:glutathione S-transferase family protein [Amphibacillus sp. Q70]|uniref:glutathione S-transferase family protein n=1 Tax=Amphibacillus sp. Q70 TaxID=3453416 RepID=UPI003F83FE38